MAVPAMSSRLPATTLAVIALVTLGAVVPPAAAQPNPERNAYFGETHVHTSWSLDAWLFGNRLTGPADAYKYFKGEPIKHPAGYEIKIETPLDWAGVTDHSEYVGVIKFANDPKSPVSKLPAAQPLIIRPDKPLAEEMQRISVYGVNVLMGGPPVKSLTDPAIAGSVWQETVAAAQQANEPQKFTAFCSYEWTSMPNNMNMHWNVFFKDCAKVPPMPFSALDSPFPEELCNSATIRGNSSSGMWADGSRSPACSARLQGRASSATPRPTSSTTGRSSPRWSARRSGSPSTSWVTSTWPRAARVRVRQLRADPGGGRAEPVGADRQARAALSRPPCGGQLDDAVAYRGPVRIEGSDRAGLERLLRYCARPPFALERLEQVGDNQLVYRFPKPQPDGSTQLRLTPLELIERLATLIPPPRLHRHHYHGVLALRVGEGIAALTPHRPGRAQFEHPVLRCTDSLTEQRSDGQAGAGVREGVPVPA